jgi:hypothetical protein
MKSMGMNLMVSTAMKLMMMSDIVVPLLSEMWKR